MSFRFHPEIRPHVEAITKLMEYANSRDDKAGEWSYAVYTPASKALDAMVEATVGIEVYTKMLHLRHGYNFGGNYSWLEDVEVAIQHAMDELAYEKEPIDEDA